MEKKSTMKNVVHVVTLSQFNNFSNWLNNVFLEGSNIYVNAETFNINFIDWRADDHLVNVSHDTAFFCLFFKLAFFSPSSWPAFNEYYVNDQIHPIFSVFYGWTPVKFKNMES